MPDSTPVFALPYPVGAESPNGPGQVKALALGVEGALLNLNPTTRWDRSATQSISSGSATTVVWNTTSDHGGIGNYWSAVDGSGVVTITEAGLYLIDAFIEWDSDATGYRQLILAFNGTAVADAGISGNAVSGAVTRQKLHHPYVAAANDTFKLQVVQNSGANRTVSADAFMSIIRVGALAA